MKIILSNVIAGIGELRFCSQWAFKHALLLHVPFCVSWAFLLCLFSVGIAASNSSVLVAVCLACAV